MAGSSADFLKTGQNDKLLAWISAARP